MFYWVSLIYVVLVGISMNMFKTKQSPTHLVKLARCESKLSQVKTIMSEQLHSYIIIAHIKIAPGESISK